MGSKRRLSRSELRRRCNKQPTLGVELGCVERDSFPLSGIGDLVQPRPGKHRVFRDAARFRITDLSDAQREVAACRNHDKRGSDEPEPLQSPTIHRHRPDQRIPGRNPCNYSGADCRQHGSPGPRSIDSIAATGLQTKAVLHLIVVASTSMHEIHFPVNAATFLYVSEIVLTFLSQVNSSRF